MTRSFLEMIKFEHTAFALPFAYLGLVLAGRAWDWRTAALVTVAMAAARTAGMCLNRLIDREIDAGNPRTATRALVTGELSVRLAAGAAILSMAVLIASAAALNPFCLALSPLAVLLLVAYHYLKRFTVLCHFGIGTVLACAPLGGWAAAAGSLDAASFTLAAAVLFWVAGFDVFYSLQDAEFDRREGLHSIPARYGERCAKRVAACCHLLTLFLLSALGIMLGLSLPYWIGLSLTAAILITEHALMARNPKKHVQTAFFTLNGALSGIFFVFTALAVRFA